MLVRKEWTEWRLRPARPFRVEALVVDLAPFFLGSELDRGLDHRDRRRVGRRLRSADLPEDATHLRELAEHAILHLELPLGFLDGDVRKRDRHVEDVALVQGRHEFVSELQRQRYGGDESEDA